VWSMWASCCGWLCLDDSTVEETRSSTQHQAFTNSGFSSYPSPTAPEHTCKACGGRFDSLARKPSAWRRVIVSGDRATSCHVYTQLLRSDRLQAINGAYCQQNRHLKQFYSPPASPTHDRDDYRCDRSIFQFQTICKSSVELDLVYETISGDPEGSSSHGKTRDILHSF
ncbi:E3 ubiquitin-protein ligase rififylin, partial [Anabarilius grahami]